MDFYSVSSFDKDPRRLKAGGLQEEIDQWKAGQKEWRDASPNAMAFYIKSNHDQRLQAYLQKHPELFGLRALELPALLDLAALGIVWEHPKGELANFELLIENRLLITHGSIARRFSALSAKAELEKENHQVSVMTGHTHRGGSYFLQTRTGLIQAHECFCLCSLNPPYMRNPNWQQGIALATVTENALSVEMIPFFQMKDRVYAQWRDKEYHS